ncbi:MAG: hypothetical protein HYY30_06605 [Chloroflexi bacterium]|nr:hypothetical protein [Chloroflexota bacterium]
MEIPGKTTTEVFECEPCPQCLRGHSIWEGGCERCGECGREFDANGLLLQAARCEGDLDGWGSLC